MHKDDHNRIEIPRFTTTQFFNKQHETALVVPVINEGIRLTRILEKIRNTEIHVDVIVADGGSNDGSTIHETLYQLGVCSLLTIEEDGKLSSQLRMAFYYCLEQGYERIITIDGNDKDDVAGINRIINRLSKGADFVQGSRFIKGGESINTPLHRLLAIKLLHAPLTSLFSMRKFTDSTNGFRGFSRRVLEDPKIGIFRNVFFSYELLAYLPIRISRLGYITTEVPVSRKYPSNTETPTKIRGLKTHLNLLIVLMNSGLGIYNPRKLKC
jgi:glycosyltransferase involved in cell wall biosynthesis